MMANIISQHICNQLTNISNAYHAQASVLHAVIHSPLMLFHAQRVQILLELMIMENANQNHVIQVKHKSLTTSLDGFVLTAQLDAQAASMIITDFIAQNVLNSI